MMEKYGVQQQTFEVVQKDTSIVVGSNLSLADANALQEKKPGTIVRPE